MSWHDFVRIDERCIEEFSEIKELKDVYIINALLDVERDCFTFDFMAKPFNVLEDDYKSYVSIKLYLEKTIYLEQFKNTTKETSTISFDIDGDIICCNINGGYEAIIKCTSIYGT